MTPPDRETDKLLARQKQSNEELPSSLMSMVDRQALEGDVSPTGIPIISPKTAGTLLKEINLVQDFNTLQQIAARSGMPIVLPIYLANKMAIAEFKDLLVYNPELIKGVDTWLCRTYQDDGKPVDGAMNVAAIGIALVLRAFHLEAGQGFIDRVKTLSADGIVEVMSQKDQAIKSRTISNTVMMLSIYPDIIDDYQAHLNHVINRLIFSCQPEQLMQDGCDVGYLLVKSLWESEDDKAS